MEPITKRSLHCILGTVEVEIFHVCLHDDVVVQNDIHQMNDINLLEQAHTCVSLWHSCFIKENRGCLILNISREFEIAESGIEERKTGSAFDEKSHIYISAKVGK